MILTGNEISEQWRQGRIRISQFDEGGLSTNSYDLHLGPKLLRYTQEVLDPRSDNEYEIFDIPETGYDMAAGEFLLGSTVEVFGSDHYVPKIHAKSGTARLGLFVHVTADLIDIGAHGRSTLQLYATLPIRLHRHMAIAQVTFWKPLGDVTLYNGKYQGSDGPVAARPWLD